MLEFNWMGQREKKHAVKHHHKSPFWEVLRSLFFLKTYKLVMGTGWLQWFEDWAINRDMQKVAFPKMTWSIDRYAKKSLV